MFSLEGNRWAISHPPVIVPPLMGMDSVVIVGFLLAIPWPFWRLAGSAPVRQQRRDQVALLAVLGGYGLFVIAVAIYWRTLLPVLATVAALIAVAFWWRSRPGYGRRWGIPPGRILLHPLGPFNDLDYLARQAERYGPIFKIGATFPVPTITPIVCIVGHDLGLELLRDHEKSLEVYPPFPTSRLIPHGFLRSMTLEDHDRYAPVFRHAFSSAVDSSFDQAVAISARRVLAQMHVDSLSAGDRGIAPGAYLRSFAFDILARLLFGFESQSAEQEQLAAQFRALGIERFARWLPKWGQSDQWSLAVKQLERQFGPESHPAVRSALGEALAIGRSANRDGAATLDEATIVGNILQMHESGAEDLSALLVWVVKHLGDNPTWIDRLRDEASAADATGAVGATKSLADRVIRESLRLDQSEFLLRRTKEDIRFRGFLLPKGWRVRICIREGHRDSNVFDRPTEYDPDRFLRTAHPLTAYAPLGLYRHRCVGARLTQMAGATFVDMLARGYRLTIAQDGPREHGRFHWQPSARLRVRVEACSGKIGRA